MGRKTKLSHADAWSHGLWNVAWEFRLEQEGRELMAHVLLWVRGCLRFLDVLMSILDLWLRLWLWLRLCLRYGVNCNLFHRRPMSLTAS